MNVKLIVLLLILLDAAWKVVVGILDRRSLRRKTPDSVKDVYDEAEYRKWRAYKSESKRVEAISAIAGYAVDIILIMANVYAAFAGCFPDNIYLQMLSVILLNTLVSAVVSLPFDYYSTFTVEEKYGFNKSTKKTFVADQIKDFFIELILMTLLVCAFIGFHKKFGDLVILFFTVGIILFGLIFSFLTPLFTKLFNKFQPLEEGGLKDRLTALMTKYGYKVKAIEVMDASRRSTRMNAYFTGLGPVKRIVLYDTLKEAMSEEQICAVFAHEMGHGLHHDMLRNRIVSVVQGLAIALSGWLVISTPEVFTAFGFNGVNFGFAFVLMGYILGIITPLIGLLTNTFSRKAEYRADAQAVQEGYGNELISALKLLAKNNLADLSPDPLLVKLTYSHPTLDQRITAILEKMAEDNK